VKYDSSAGSATAASRILGSSGPLIEPAMGGAAAASRLPLFRAHPVLKTLAVAERAMEQAPGAGACELFACDASLSAHRPSRTQSSLAATFRNTQQQVAALALMKNLSQTLVTAAICRQASSRGITSGCNHQAKQRAEAAAVAKGCGGCGTGCAPQTVYLICRTAKLARGRRCLRPKSLGWSGGRHSKTRML
jgi:hypothetical protein